MSTLISSHSPRYTSAAIGLHWLMAALLIGLLILGWVMHDLPLSPQKLQWYAWHKWAGVCAWGLLLIRGLWRITHRPPALPEGMKPLERSAAHVAHALLYGWMLCIPLSGWLMSSAKGFQTVLFGLWPIPDLLSKNPTLGEQLQGLHGALNALLAVTIAGHVAAALKHHFVHHDGTLTRMLPQGLIKEKV